MAENLAFDITADSTKARAQIDALKLALRDLRKEQRALLEEQRRNQGGDPTQLLAVTRQIQLTEKEIAKYTVTTRAMTAANAEASKSFREFGLEAGHFAHLAGIPIEGIKALRFGLLSLAGVEVIRSLTDVSDRIAAIVKQSKQTGFAPQVIQTLGLAAQKTGGDAADAASMIDKLGASIDAAEKKALEAGQTLGGPTVLKGGTSKDAAQQITNLGNVTTTVLRGGQTAVVDFTDSLEKMGISVTRIFQQFPNEAERRLEVLRQLSQGLENLVKQGKLPEANLRSIELTGASYERLGPALKLAIDQQKQLVEELRQSGQLLDKDGQKKAEEYKTAIDGLTLSFKGLQQQIALTAFPDLTGWINQLQEALKRPEGQKTAWEEFLAVDQFIALTEKLKRQWQDFLDWMAAADAKLKAAHDALWAGIGGAAHAVVSSGGDAAAASPFAAGGHVRGPGTGTSDSILARLSNGEFVLNAGSVRRLGVGFLEGLNSFAAGGLIGAQPLRFAEGGLVPSGGRAVHLHLGSQSFALSGNDNVVSALVTAAGRQQMRSAGVKPSWYG